MIRGKFQFSRCSITLWVICAFALGFAGSTTLQAQTTAGSRPSFAANVSSGQVPEYGRKLAVARDEIRKAFIGKDYERVLSISDQIRSEYPSYSADSFYETAAQMRLSEKARLAEGQRAYPKLEDQPVAKLDLSAAPPIGLEPDLEKQLARDPKNQIVSGNSEPVAIQIASINTSTAPSGTINEDPEMNPYAEMTPIPALTPILDEDPAGNPPTISPVDQGEIPPGIAGPGNDQPSPPIGISEQQPEDRLIATASTPVPIDSALTSTPNAATGGSKPITILGVTLPMQLGYILLGIILMVIIIVVGLQFIGRRREDRDLEVALATHGGTLSGTQGGLLLDEEEEEYQYGYPEELDNHSGSTQIDAFDEDSNPQLRESIQGNKSSASAVAEVAKARPEPADQGSDFDQDDFEALFATDDEPNPDEQTGMETGIMDSGSADLPAADFGELEIPAMNFHDMPVNEAEETYRIDMDEDDNAGGNVVLDHEMNVGSPSIWSELDTPGDKEDSDVISFDDLEDSVSVADDVSDVDMGSATHTSFEERAMESTNGMSDSEIQKSVDEDLPAVDMTMREFHKDETVDVNMSDVTSNEAEDSFAFEEPELSPTHDMINFSDDVGSETLGAAALDMEQAASEPELASTSDATSMAELASAAEAEAKLDIESPEIAETHGADDLQGMETLIVDPPDFGADEKPAPSGPTRSAIQDLIQGGSKPQQAPADKSPIVNTGDSLFDRELRQGQEAFESEDWGRAVHHLSIAAALKPDNKKIREQLREARSKRNQG